jgi:hypothetical protein
VQKVSGAKVSKKTKRLEIVVVRFVNILTDISQQVIDIYQSIYIYSCYWICCFSGRYSFNTAKRVVNQ